MVKVRIVLSLLEGLGVSNSSLHPLNSHSNIQFGKKDFLILASKIKGKK